MGGAAGFLVGNLKIPGHEQPWESHAPYPSMNGHVIIQLMITMTMIIIFCSILSIQEIAMFNNTFSLFPFTIFFLLE